MAMKKYRNVEQYFDELTQYEKELGKLREILNATDLEETLKWSIPCYTYNGKNVCGISAFKSYFGLWFFQGALLTDPDDVLMNAQEGKTKAMRQWRMEKLKDIKVRTIKKYVKEGIELVKDGKQIKPTKKKTLVVPDLLESALAKNKKALEQFSKLTPYKQREYAEYISDAKRDETKVKRLAKIMPMIASGKGLNDKYRTV